MINLLNRSQKQRENLEWFSFMTYSKRELVIVKKSSLSEKNFWITCSFLKGLLALA